MLLFDGKAGIGGLILTMLSATVHDLASSIDTIHHGDFAEVVSQDLSFEMFVVNGRFVFIGVFHPVHLWVVADRP